MFAQENILSGQGPQIPTIVVPQNGGPVKTVTLVEPALPDTPLDCVLTLSTQDDASYADWAATGGSVLVGARDYWTSSTPLFAVEATEVDASIGSFSFRVPSNKTIYPGIFLLEVGLYNATDVLVVANAGYLEITPSVAYSQDAAPLSVARIRRAIRDAHPRNNRVLEECEFSLAEIMDQIQFTVDEYNMTNMPMTSWNGTNFPYPSMLILGVVANLMDMASIWYARNDLKVESAGLRADDMGKAQIYTALADRYRERWMRWVTMHKRNVNIGRGWGTVRSRMY